MNMKRTFLFGLGLLLAACSGETGNSHDDNSPENIASPKPITETQVNAQNSLKQSALKTPDWAKINVFPDEWTGLYVKNCYMAGPEDSRFFNVRDARSQTQYYFSYIVFPPATGHKAEANVVVINYDGIWQNKSWPDHYLLFAQNHFSQILIEDNRSYGQHQTLDGRPWDSMAHINTKYRATDKSRWAVDLNNQEDYGSGSACDVKLAEPWQNIRFTDKKTGQEYILPDVLQRAGLSP